MLDKKVVKAFTKVVGKDDIVTEPTLMLSYARDRLPVATSNEFIRDKIKLPAAVVRPETSEEISEIVKLANKHRIPLIPRSAGTGFMGQSIPVRPDSIVIDMRKMDQILDINPDDMRVTVEAGICTERLDLELSKQGLIVGHDPGSAPASTIGGAVATDGVGALTDKYGVIRDMVRGMEVVTPTGEILQLSNAPKSSIGYNLRYLFIGSEGTLGIVTKVTLMLKTIAQRRVGFWEFDTFESAYKAFGQVRKLDAVPARFSINDKGRSSDYEDIAGKKLNASVVACFLEPAHLLDIKYDLVNRLLEENGGKKLPQAVADYWWNGRHIYSSIGGVWQDAETSVPWSRVLEMRHGAMALFEKSTYKGEPSMGVFTVEPATFGMDMYFDENDPADVDGCLKLEMGLRRLAFQLGGSMSHAHGTGIQMADVAKEELGNKFRLMQQIKKTLDPNNIMNPGKMGFE